jgi:hypothetical protein
MLRLFLHIFMVIRGVRATETLASGKSPAMSSREKKLAVIVVIATLFFLAIIVAVTLAVNRQ